MPRLEIHRENVDGEIISIHEGVSINPDRYRDYHARIYNGFEARDRDGSLVEMLVINGKGSGIEFRDSEVCLTGFVAYKNSRRARPGEVSYERDKDDSQIIPPGPDSEKEAHTWVVSFPQSATSK